jgi:capsular polysaccharide transport system permease protein
VSDVSTTFERQPIAVGFMRLWNSLVALMLRDIKTRFLGNAWGMLLSLGWPLTHIIILLLLNTLLGRVHPHGDSAALWYASGIVPFIFFNYMARYITFGAVINAPLLNFPAIKFFDIILARVIVEILSTGIILMMVFLLLIPFDVIFFPNNIVLASKAVAIAMILGIGYGVLAAVLTKMIPVIGIASVLFMIILWMISGVIVHPDGMPEVLQNALAYNPMLHPVLMFRAAFYDGYAQHLVDPQYAFWFGVSMLILALLVERMLRGALLQ